MSGKIKAQYPAHWKKFSKWVREVPASDVNARGMRPTLDPSRSSPLY